MFFFYMKVVVYEWILNHSTPCTTYVCTFNIIWMTPTPLLFYTEDGTRWQNILQIYTVQEGFPGGDAVSILSYSQLFIKSLVFTPIFSPRVTWIGHPSTCPSYYLLKEADDRFVSLSEVQLKRVECNKGCFLYHNKHGCSLVLILLPLHLGQDCASTNF